MNNTVRIVAASAALALLSACGEAGSAAGNGAHVVGTEKPATSRNDAPGKADGGAGKPKFGTRGNPLPIGTKIKVGDWQVAVTSVKRDGWSEIHKANEFNEKPAAGRKFVMFAVSATYLGKQSGDPTMDLSWAVVGSKGNTYGTSPNDDCGVLPHSLDDAGETFPNGKVNGNVCVSVPANQLNGATIRLDESMAIEPSRAFYALS